jgi:hypothetical protein
MSESWRLNIDLREEGHARALIDRLQAAELEHDLASSFHDRVFLNRHGAEVSAYAADRSQAGKVAELVKSLAEKHGWHIETELLEWDEVKVEWTDASHGVPHDTRHQAAHTQIIAQERASSLAHGYPDWEVKVECPSHHAVLALAKQLTAEQIPNVHRWRYLVVGANDEDSGNALAKRIRKEAPEGTITIVQASPQATLANRPSNPFAVFGGLGV